MERCRISQETERMLHLGHPWVLKDKDTALWKRMPLGCVMQLVNKDGAYVATALYDPHDKIVARVLSWHASMQLTEAWISDKIQQALKKRHNLFMDGQTTAYRLINAEGDALPGITVDRYGDFLMVQLYSEAWRPHLSLLVTALDRLCTPAGIYEKKRPRDTRTLEQRNGSKQYGILLHGKPVPVPHIVQELGIRYEVDLQEGLDTGLFLDQRENRKTLMQIVANKRFLNLFAYTGAFSLAAAIAGAQACTSIDISPRYTQIHKKNILLNFLSKQRCTLVVDDCLRALAKLKEQGERFDVILLDPPSFSTTGKGMFTTKKGTSELVAAALAVLHDGGTLICSSNHQKTDLADYLKELRRGALEAGCFLSVTHQTGQPFDFPYPVTLPEGRYLKFVMAVKQPLP